MIEIKNKQAIGKMREAGKRLAEVMECVGALVVPGVSTFEIDAVIEAKMRKSGLNPSCKGYAGYAFATCISINEVLVHGVPSKRVILKTGDFVKVDMVGSYKGYCADMARGFFVGESVHLASTMAYAAQNALDCAIGMVRPGIRLSEISCRIQAEIEAAGFSVVREFAGHGIGKRMHEEPEIPNYEVGGSGPVLQVGMALAFEPMLTERPCTICVSADDKWSARTSDGCLAAHVEDTVLVMPDGPEVLTRLG